jgi:hypothetical protein
MQEDIFGWLHNLYWYGESFDEVQTLLSEMQGIYN